MAAERISCPRGGGLLLSPVVVRPAGVSWPVVVLNGLTQGSVHYVNTQTFFAALRLPEEYPRLAPLLADVDESDVREQISALSPSPHEIPVEELLWVGAGAAVGVGVALGILSCPLTLSCL